MGITLPNSEETFFLQATVTVKKTGTDRVLCARDIPVFLNLSLRKQSEAYDYDVCD